MSTKATLQEVLEATRIHHKVIKNAVMKAAHDKRHRGARINQGNLKDLNLGLEISIEKMESALRELQEAAVLVGEMEAALTARA